MIIRRVRLPVARLEGFVHFSFSAARLRCRFQRLSQPLILHFYDAFTFGVGTHLLGDVIKRGNLVWFTSGKREYAWYILNGIVWVVLVTLTGFIPFVDLGASFSLSPSSPWLSFLRRPLLDYPWQVG